MNKLAKGALAGGLGIALLLGGGATLAFWNDSVPVSGATITAGSLDVAATGTPTWTVSNGSVSNQAVTDIATFRMVPGDVLTYKAAYTVAAVGDNLKAQASLGTAALTGDADLIARLTPATTVAVGAGAASAGPVAVVNGDVLNVTVTITWPFDTPAGTSPSLDNPAMGDAVSFANFYVVVRQVAP